MFTNTGVPLPTYGCHAFMDFTSPSGTVSCKASTPTTGANTFSCEGPATTEVLSNDGNETVPNVVRPEELVTADGLAGFGTVPSTCDNAGQAKQNVAETLSGKSIDCLAKLLDSGSSRSRIAVRSLSVGARRRSPSAS